MGTQFWWFYDVLAVAMTFGICYAVIAKGFNKVVFQLAAFLSAILIGILGANFLAPRVYEELFSEKVETSVQKLLEQDSFELYELVSENLALSAHDDEEAPDAGALHQMYLDARDGAALEEWYVSAFGTVLMQQLDRAQKLHPISGNASLSWMFEPEGEFDFLGKLEEPQASAALARLTADACYRENYTQLVRLSLFLVIELVMLIICSIIASMTDQLEQSMHLRKSDRPLAIPVALVEAASMLFIVCVVVRLIVQITDGEMLLFNQPTIQETFIFQHIYGVQDMLFGSRS